MTDCFRNVWSKSCPAKGSSSRISQSDDPFRSEPSSWSRPNFFGSDSMACRQIGRGKFTVIFLFAKFGSLVFKIFPFHFRIFYVTDGSRQLLLYSRAHYSDISCENIPVPDEKKRELLRRRCGSNSNTPYLSRSLSPSRPQRLAILLNYEYYTIKLSCAAI